MRVHRLCQCEKSIVVVRYHSGSRQSSAAYHLLSSQESTRASIGCQNVDREVVSSKPPRRALRVRTYNKISFVSNSNRNVEWAKAKPRRGEMLCLLQTNDLLDQRSIKSTNIQQMVHQPAPTNVWEITVTSERNA